MVPLGKQALQQKEKEKALESHAEKEKYQARDITFATFSDRKSPVV